jgi:hypothetical protein
MNNEHSIDDNQAMVRQVVDSLDQSIEHLDGHTLSRLNRARHQALAQTLRPRLIKAEWLKAGAVVALIALLVNGWLMFTTPDAVPIGVDDFEMILVNEDFELMQDLEFFVWMIEQEDGN